MSAQAQPQQPVVVYPNTVAGQPPPHHSDGSFGTVFIVLAVIIVISAIACFLGRLCNRRFSKSNPKPLKQSHSSRPKERDLEFGFDGRMPTAKPVGFGDPRGFRMPGPEGIRGEPRVFRGPENGDIRGQPRSFRISENGDIKGEPKPVDAGDLRAGA